MRRRSSCVLALIASVSAASAADVPGSEVPFGLAWGPVDRIEPPSMIDREANLTGLYYIHDWLLAAGQDTVEEVLMICPEEGLQQVVWVGASAGRCLRGRGSRGDTLRRRGSTR